MFSRISEALRDRRGDMNSMTGNRKKGLKILENVRRGTTDILDDLTQAAVRLYPGLATRTQDFQDEIHEIANLVLGHPALKKSVEALERFRVGDRLLPEMRTAADILIDYAKPNTGNRNSIDEFTKSDIDETDDKLARKFPRCGGVWGSLRLTDRSDIANVLAVYFALSEILDVVYEALHP